VALRMTCAVARDERYNSRWPTLVKCIASSCWRKEWMLLLTRTIYALSKESSDIDKWQISVRIALRQVRVRFNSLNS
jgi:hypothetical protein